MTCKFKEIYLTLYWKHRSSAGCVEREFNDQKFRDLHTGTFFPQVCKVALRILQTPFLLLQNWNSNIRSAEQFWYFSILQETLHASVEQCKTLTNYFVATFYGHIISTSNLKYQYLLFEFLIVEIPLFYIKFSSQVWRKCYVNIIFINEQELARPLWFYFWVSDEITIRREKGSRRRDRDYQRCWILPIPPSFSVLSCLILAGLLPHLIFIWQSYLVISNGWQWFFDLGAFSIHWCGKSGQKGIKNEILNPSQQTCVGSNAGRGITENEILEFGGVSRGLESQKGWEDETRDGTEGPGV